MGSRDSHGLYHSDNARKMSSTSSETNLVESQGQMFGGIRVSQEVMVAVKEVVGGGPQSEPGESPLQ